jgi:hypothetical protein
MGMNSDLGRVNGPPGRVSLNGSGFTAGMGRARLLARPAGPSVHTKEEAGCVATWAARDGWEGRLGWAGWDLTHIA